MPSYFAKPTMVPRQRISIADTLCRTASQSASNLFDREIERAYRSRHPSQYHTNRTRVYDWINALDNVTCLQTDWNSYGAPAPCQNAVDGAREVLEKLSDAAIAPDNLKASAEGGVAIVLSGSDRNRAIIESLNNGERYILLYDLDGKNDTIDWPVSADPAELVRRLKDHLRGLPLAA
jgi:hypothetical protein